MLHNLCRHKQNHARLDIFLASPFACLLTGKLGVLLSLLDKLLLRNRILFFILFFFVPFFVEITSFLTPFLKKKTYRSKN